MRELDERVMQVPACGLSSVSFVMRDSACGGGLGNFGFSANNSYSPAQHFL